MSVIVSLAFWTSSGLFGSKRNSKSPYPVFSTSIPGKGLLLFSIVLSCACAGLYVRPSKARQASEERQSPQIIVELAVSAVGKWRRGSACVCDQRGTPDKREYRWQDSLSRSLRF